MNTESSNTAVLGCAAAPPSAVPASTAFGCPRDFLENRFVYTVISPRARGLSVGLNLNPDQRCNFDCVYCEVDRRSPARETALDVSVMLAELQQTLEQVRSGELRQRPHYRFLPDELMELRHVALSGDGEPTRCPQFLEAVESLVHLRAQGHFAFFKLVLITNASGLHVPQVEEALRLFHAHDEVWAKLEAGNHDAFLRINQPDCALEFIQGNILRLARRRPVIIQSLFPTVNGAGPCAAEIEAYVERLGALKKSGAQIPLVQIYSATRPTHHRDCGHLTLAALSRIARRVREVTGLRAEVF